MITEKQIWMYGIMAIVIVFAGGFFYNSYALNYDVGYEFPSPEETARSYLESWHMLRYADMYSVISDGFKKIEPTAASFDVFRENMENLTVKLIDIISVEELGNDGKTASVQYQVIFENNNSEKIPYTGIFSLRFREGDLVKGWKLIHPYGNNIDTG